MPVLLALLALAALLLLGPELFDLFDRPPPPPPQPIVIDTGGNEVLLTVCVLAAMAAIGVAVWAVVRLRARPEAAQASAAGTQNAIATAALAKALTDFTHVLDQHHTEARFERLRELERGAQR